MISMDHTFLIENVLHVDGLQHNLLSINQLCSTRYNVSFNKYQCVVKSDKSIISFVKRRENLYKIYLHELLTQKVSCLPSSKEYD